MTEERFMRLQAALFRDFAAMCDNLADGIAESASGTEKVNELVESGVIPPKVRTFECPGPRCKDAVRVDQMHAVPAGDYTIDHSVRVLEHDDVAAHCEISVNGDRFKRVVMLDDAA